MTGVPAYAKGRLSLEPSAGVHDDWLGGYGRVRVEWKVGHREDSILRPASGGTWSWGSSWWSRYAIDAIRIVDPDRWIFVEPRYGAPGNGMPSYHPTLEDPRPGSARITYSPHLYSLSYEQYQRYDPGADHAVANWERERLIELDRQPMPMVMGEWGFDWTFPGADVYGRAVLEMADRLQAGWAYWVYDTGTWGLHDGSGADRPSADTMVRPYARAIAGVPLTFSYDADTRVFLLTFEDREGIDGPTEIALPVRRHYPSGWELVVSDVQGTWSSSFDSESEILSLTTPRTGGTHQVEVRPLP